MIKLFLEASVTRETCGVLSSGSSGERLVEDVLDIVIINRSDGPSELFLKLVECLGLNILGVSNGTSCMIKSRLEGRSPGFNSSSLGCVQGFNRLGHGSPLGLLGSSPLSISLFVNLIKSGL